MAANALIPPNLTNVKLRRTGGDCALMHLQCDPAWGIPYGQPPLSIDATTGLVRPFSSYTTLAAAVATFVGFTEEAVPPGELRSVWVHTEGWVEMKVDTPAVILAGSFWEPLLITATTPDHVSDDTVTASTAADVMAIFRAVRSCPCNPSWESVVCPPAPVDANNTSPTEAIDRQTQRTVLLHFNTNRVMNPAGA